MRTAATILGLIIAFGLPAVSHASEHCQTVADGSGSVDNRGSVTVIGSWTSSCPDLRSTDESDFPKEFWSTHDIYWADQGSCPDGEIRGVRRHYVIPARGAEPTFAYDSTGCVPIPATGDELDVDATDIEAILRGQLPLPVVARDPYVDGLTGLETYFWYDGDLLTPVDHDTDPTTPDRAGWQATIAHNGITITATLHVTRFTWKVAPGEHVTATVPGTPDRPAASHSYRTTGSYDLIASTTWAGHYTWTLAGTSNSGTLNEVTLDSPPEPFRVREVRAVPGQAGS
jgi:hypothetical protein